MYKIGKNDVTRQVSCYDLKVVLFISQDLYSSGSGHCSTGCSGLCSLPSVHWQHVPEYKCRGE